MSNTTNTPAVGLIWAQGRNGIIGQQGQMPWHLPEDLAHFKNKTMGCPVIMGRKTWDSIPPPFRPLPGRRNLVITRQQGWVSAGAEAFASVEEALVACRHDQRVWVIGGGQIYAQALPYADTVEMTQIDLQPDGDTRAPKLDDEWNREGSSAWMNSRTGLRYRFATYVRLLPAKALGAEFSSTLSGSEFPSTQAPTGFENTQGASIFPSTLPPGLLP
jgi:dihydrofolate reductase